MRVQQIQKWFHCFEMGRTNVFHGTAVNLQDVSDYHYQNNPNRSIGRRL